MICSAHALRLLRRSVATALIPAALLTAAASAQDERPHASPEAAAPEVVPFAFGWPEGTEARVVLTRTRVRVSPEGTDSTAGALAYTMRVAPHPEGLLVSYGDVEMDADTLAKEDRVYAEAAVSGLFPDLVVSPEGHFLRVENVGALRDRLRALLAPFADSARAVNPDAAGALDDLLSEEVLTASAAEEWGVAVGFWLGAELEVEALYELEAEGPLLIMPGRTVPMRTEFGVAGWVPCQEPEGALVPKAMPKEPAEPACVELLLETYPDEGAVAAAIAEFIGRLTPEDGVPLIEHYWIVTGARLVVDPATMLPYRVRTYKEFEVAVAEPGGDVEEVYQYEEKTRTYTYEE